MLKQKLLDVLESTVTFIAVCLVLVFGTGLLGPLHFALFETVRFLFRFGHRLLDPIFGMHNCWQFYVVAAFAIHAWLLAWIIKGIMAVAKVIHKAAMDAYHLFLKVRATLQRWLAAWRKWCGEDEAECVEEINLPTNNVQASEALVGEEQ